MHLCNTKPLQINSLLYRYRVTNAHGTIRIIQRPIAKNHLRIRSTWSTRDVLGEAHTQESTPLLDFLFQIRIQNQRVSRSMERQHLGIRAVVSRIHSFSLSNPSRLRLDVFAIRAIRVCAHGTVSWRASQTASRDAGVACCSGNEIRVGDGEYVGHHAAGGGPCDVDFGRVSVVGLDGVLDHLC